MEFYEIWEQEICSLSHIIWLIFNESNIAMAIIGIYYVVSWTIKMSQFAMSNSWNHVAPPFDIFGSCDHFDSREISNLDVIGLNRIKHEQLFLILEILITRQLPILSLSHKVKVITLQKMFQILKPRDQKLSISYRMMTPIFPSKRC